MRFFKTALVAFSALATLVMAQQNPITEPTAGTTFNAGNTVTIKWTVTTKDPTVSLILRKGDSSDLGTVGDIGTDIPNSGSYTWKVPKDFAKGDDYSIQIHWPTGDNYSPLFTLNSDVVSTTSTTVTTTTETETSTTETETSTTETETSTTETETSTSTTEVTTTTTTAETSSITLAPNSTTFTTTTTTTSKAPKTTTPLDGGNVPTDPGKGGASSNSVSLALLLCVGAAWVYLL